MALRDRGRHTATIGFAASMLLFAVVVAVATGYHLVVLRDTELRRQQDSAANHARVFEDHLTQVLRVVDLALQRGGDGSAGLARDAGAGAFEATLRHAPYLRSLSLVDVDGRIVVSSNPGNLGRVPRLDALLPVAADNAPLLRFGRPWSGRDFADGRPADLADPSRRDGLGFVPVLRAAGDGMRILAAVNPDYFLNHIVRTLPAGEGSAEVVRYDGVLLFGSDEGAHAVRPGLDYGVAGLPDGAALGREHGLLAYKRIDGGVDEMAYRASRLYPLTVVVRLDRERALAAWRRQASALLGVVLPTFGLAVVLAVLIFRHVQRVDRERHEEALRARDRLAGRMFEASAEAIVVTDRANRIVAVNPAYTRLTGYARHEVLGLNPGLSRSDRQDERFYAAMWDSLRRCGTWKGELVNRRKDGSRYTAALTVSAVVGEDGQVVNYFGIFSDISERKAREDRIRFLSEHDVLTGLPNRALFQDRLERAIALGQRHGGRLAVLFIDLDRFKPINDTLGHDAGDAVLREVGRRVSATVRASDTVCRHGGDEFLVMLPEVDGAEDAGRVATKVLAALAQPVEVAGTELRVGASIGIAVHPEDGTTPEALIRAADTAMYHGKARGRGNFHFFTTAMDEVAGERLAMEQGLRRALEQGGFELHYQPLVAPDSGRVTGVEALLRWRDETLGDVPPARFIPVAEESRLIVPIGEWVLREACRQLQAWATNGAAPAKVAVNVSPIQLGRAGFADTVHRALDDFGVDGARLELEVTESVLVDHDQGRNAELQALRAKGVRVAIDDFGTGYSSLASLRRLPVDKIKIDRSFVADLDGDPEDALIVGALIDMARSIGLQVLGEGVETEAQLDYLRGRGCDEVQGFLIHQPLPPAALMDWMRAQDVMRHGVQPAAARDPAAVA